MKNLTQSQIEDVVWNVLHESGVQFPTQEKHADVMGALSVEIASALIKMSEVR